MINFDHMQNNFLYQSTGVKLRLTYDLFNGSTLTANEQKTSPGGQIDASIVDLYATIGPFWAVFGGFA